MEDPLSDPELTPIHFDLAAVVEDSDDDDVALARHPNKYI